MTRFIRWLLPRLITSLLTLAIFLGVSEWAVQHYVIYSDGLGFTLMYNRWHKKYWHPVNSYGYRDIEWPAEQLVGKTKIIVTGDSFPAGHGTNDIADRFPNVLQQELGDDYAVMLVARQGWEMNLVLKGLAGYPSSADALVVSYYINDIVTACQTVLGEYIYEEGIPQPTGIVQQVVDHSHLANYVYWNFYARTRMTDTFERWDQRTQDCFTSDEVWAYHQGELQALYDWTVIHEIPMVVVLFPSLVNIEAYDTALGRVEDFFTGLGVTVINQSETWKTYPVEERVVNSLDSHPSVKLHHEIGEALAALDVLRHPDAHKPSLPDFVTEIGKSVYEDYRRADPPIPPDSKVLIPLSDDLAINVYRNFAAPLLGDSDVEHIMVGLMLRDIWLASRRSNLWFSQGEEKKLYQQWQETREPAYLTQLGIDYVFVTSTWQGWLSKEEASTLTDPAKYEVVQKRDFGDEQYSLLRVVK